MVNVFLPALFVSIFCKSLRLQKTSPFHSRPVVNRYRAVFLLCMRFYIRHVCPQSWQTAIFIVLVTTRCFFGIKIFANSAGIVKKIHFIGTHHQPTNVHHKQPWCASFDVTLLVSCMLTLSLLHFGHVMIIFPLNPHFRSMCTFHCSLAKSHRMILRLPFHNPVCNM
jgi:hypothetical protein